MTAIIYTYPPDYLMAGISACVMASQGIRVIIAIDAEDPYFACEHALVLRTPFIRRGNLNGREFILGHLDLMRVHASGDYTLKVDSDTLLINAPDFFEGRNEIALGVHVNGMNGMQGCCYALRSDYLPQMIHAAGKLEHGVRYMEDKTIGGIARSLGPVYLPVWQQDDRRYASWKEEVGIEWYRSNKAVVTFPLKESGRAGIATAMKNFLPLMTE